MQQSTTNGTLRDRIADEQIRVIHDIDELIQVHPNMNAILDTMDYMDQRYASFDTSLERLAVRQARQWTRGRRIDAHEGG